MVCAVVEVTERTDLDGRSVRRWSGGALAVSKRVLLGESEGGDVLVTALGITEPTDPLEQGLSESLILISSRKLESQQLEPESAWWPQYPLPTPTHFHLYLLDFHLSVLGHFRSVPPSLPKLRRSGTLDCETSLRHITTLGGPLRLQSSIQRY